LPFIHIMDPRIAAATAYIEQHLHEPFDVTRLAATVNLSPSRFSRLFRAEWGISPLRYVRNKRMERARILLERTFLSVKEVMTQVGCNDPSHFARDFRAYHGMPPREWRIAVGARARELLQDGAPPIAEAADEPLAAVEPVKPPKKSEFRQHSRAP
jgi:transcriptional regulator GlxA family with amidase domain